MVDFGLAKPFIDADTGRHIPYSENRSICGTLRYISLNVHKVSLFNQISYLYNTQICCISDLIIFCILL